MYHLKINKDDNVDLKTTFGTIKKIKARTGKKWNELANDLEKLDLDEIFELFADGYDGDRQEFIKKLEDNLAPVYAQTYLFEFIMEINFNGVSEEDRKTFFSQGLTKLQEQTGANLEKDILSKMQ